MSYEVDVDPEVAARITDDNVPSGVQERLATALEQLTEDPHDGAHEDPVVGAVKVVSVQYEGQMWWWTFTLVIDDEDGQVGVTSVQVSTGPH